MRNPKRHDTMKIYVASSWRNPFYADVLRILREAGHDVWDWRNPPTGGNGFKWQDAGAPDYQHGDRVDTATYKAMVETVAAQAGFQSDLQGMMFADICVLLLPSGRSAHMEAGYMCGRGKPVHVLRMIPDEPDLMHLLFDEIHSSPAELVARLEVIKQNAASVDLRGEVVDPIHYVPHPEGDLAAGWYFWDETWSNREGPFAGREQAQAAMAVYSDGL
jgi:hypothetical protein